MTHYRWLVAALILFLVAMAIALFGPADTTRWYYRDRWSVFVAAGLACLTAAFMVTT
jgi:hypothetical protein